MDKITALLDWLNTCALAALSISQDQRFLPALWFVLILLGVLAIIVGIWVVWLIFKPNSKHDGATALTDRLDYKQDEVLNVVVKDGGQRFVIVSKAWLNKSDFQEGDQARLEIQLTPTVLEEGVTIARKPLRSFTTVTIKQVPRRREDYNAMVEVSQTALNQFGAELGKIDLAMVEIKKLTAVSNIWARTFAHPDINIRLGFQLFVWSFVAGIVGNIIVDHLPF